MHQTEPTADDYRAAYKASKLRRVGVSLQRALTAPCVRIALRGTAVALRKKQGKSC